MAYPQEARQFLLNAAYNLGLPVQTKGDNQVVTSTEDTSVSAMDDQSECTGEGNDGGGALSNEDTLEQYDSEHAYEPSPQDTGREDYGPSDFQDEDSVRHGVPNNMLQQDGVVGSVRSHQGLDRKSVV